MTPGRILTAALIAALAAGSATGCGRPGDLSATEKKQVTDSIEKLVRATYDLSAPNAVARLMSIYPDSGPVYSTSSGHVSTTRAELQQQIETFWKYVGTNMKNPKWEWTSMYIDVLGPDAAVLTASYRIPHLTPRDTPHVIAGAWTAAFARRGGRWVVIQEHLSDMPQTADTTAAMDHSMH